MYYFVQYETKREYWSMVAANHSSSKSVAFRTVLQISADPDEYVGQGIDPNSKVQYFGPMYFDLDGEYEDRTEVIEEAKKLYKELVEQEGIAGDAITIFLSGGRGFHFLINQGVFGIKKPTTALPLYWRFYSEKFTDRYQFIDQSVYSMGRGRMWRTTQVQRENGNWKVQVTAKELDGLTEETYDQLASMQRPEFSSSENVEEVPKLISFVSAVEERVKNFLKGSSQQDNSVAVEVLRREEGIPGCIEHLITEGDCPESNWNQASMQLAAYIAARYSRNNDKDIYEKELVEPFLANVESSSRNSDERRASLTSQLNRAFSGKLTYSAGGIIKVIGKPCGSCVVCKGEEALEGPGAAVEDEFSYYDAVTKIQIDKYGVYLRGENSNKPLVRTGLRVIEYEEEFNERQHTHDIVETLIEFGNGEKIKVAESDLLKASAFTQTLASAGEPFLGTDRDCAELFTTLKVLRSKKEKKMRYPTAGLVLHRDDTGEEKPHFIGRGGSIAAHGMETNLIFTGSPHLAPDLKDLPIVRNEMDAETMAETISNLFKINEKELMIRAIGWVCAATIKPFIMETLNGFPLLNFSGSSHTGKSTTAYLILALNGFTFRKVPIWNAEVDTIYPLEELVVSSTSLVRMIEEANEHTAQKYWERLLGFLKGAWDQAGISRGTLRKRGIEVITRTNSAPLMYLSEQPVNVQAIRSRSVECMFKPISILNDEYKMPYRFVEDHNRYIEMMGLCMIQESLRLTKKEVRDWIWEAQDKIGTTYSGRTKDANAAVLSGIRFLAKTMEKYCEATAAEINEHYDYFLDSFQETAAEETRKAAYSALDEALNNINQMALDESNESYGITAGIHYWKDNGLVYIDIRSTFPRYRRFLRSQGYDSSIKTVSQFEELIIGEVYYEKTIPNPDIPGARVTVLNEAKLEGKNLIMSHLKEYSLN